MKDYSYKTSYSVKKDANGAKGDFSVKTSDGLDFAKSVSGKDIDDVSSSLMAAIDSYYKTLKNSKLNGKTEGCKCDKCNSSCDKIIDDIFDEDCGEDDFWGEKDETQELEDRLRSLKIDYDILNQRVRDLQRENVVLQQDKVNLKDKLASYEAKAKTKNMSEKKTSDFGLSSLVADLFCDYYKRI